MSNIEEKAELAQQKMAASWLRLQQAMFNDSGRWMSVGIAQNFLDSYQHFSTCKNELAAERNKDRER